MLIQELIQCIEQSADPALAAEWDQSGMQVAGTKDQIHRLALTLDPRPEFIRQAVDWDADFILTHHPLTLSPRLPRQRDDVHSVYSLLFQSGAALYAAHTSLDVQAQGPAGWLARSLSCFPIRPVHPIQSPAQVWISLNCSLLPPATLDQIMTHPGCLEWVAVDEDCWVLVPETEVDSMLQILSATTLVRVRTMTTLPIQRQHGYGIIGQLPEPVAWPTLANMLSTYLDRTTWSRIGPVPDLIHSVAYCPGSGMDLAAQAFAQGADIFISGDLKYHQAQEIEPLGLTLDVGHFCLEEMMMSTWAQSLKQELAGQGVEVVFIPGRDPFVLETCTG
ncbi:MAG: Nif3-like dinuclear metal center hexameric protein [Desulfovermiculus sp.]